MKRKLVRRGFYGLFTVFVVLNIIAAIHAYRFTHFQPPVKAKSNSEAAYTFMQKLKILLTGIDNPKPTAKYEKPADYEEIVIASNVNTYCWYKKLPDAKGTVLMFHGYGGEKSGMLNTAAVFTEMGYSTMLVDLMGAGESHENVTTIGFKESQQVIDCFNYLANKTSESIFLFGSSMGAVAIMKATSGSSINPKGIILECPFGTMYETVKARFGIMKVPAFPMAGLLVFWGGVENGFWAFDHNPEQYAAGIRAPALLLYGGEDPKVSLNEIQRIFNNLKGPRSLQIYENAGHESYLNKYKNEWTAHVSEFLTDPSRLVN